MAKKQPGDIRLYGPGEKRPAPTVDTSPSENLKGAYSLMTSKPKGTTPQQKTKSFVDTAVSISQRLKKKREEEAARRGK